MDFQNNIIQTESNAYSGYNIPQNNYDRNQSRMITNKARQLIKAFKMQHQIDTDNNQQIFPTEINQNQNPQNEISSSQKKAREELESYDYIIRGEGANNNKSQKNNLVNEIPVQNIDIMNQENAKLKKQVMNLILENNNLKKRVNYNNSNNNINNYSFPSPMIIKENNNNITQIKRQDQILRADSDNNMNNNNFNQNVNITDNNINMKDKIFFEESIESIIKSNMRSAQNNPNMKKNLYELKSKDNNKILYYPRTPNYNYNNYNNYINENSVPNYNYNTVNNMKMINNDKYSNLIFKYNQLLSEYQNTKIKLENMKNEYQNNKGLYNKYRILNNNYNDLQNRNKELVISFQKMKNENVILSQHVEDLNRQKKKFGKQTEK